jgi:hypothetical protein
MKSFDATDADLRQRKQFFGFNPTDAEDGLVTFFCDFIY